jgi:hypothetical protein
MKQLPAISATSIDEIEKALKGCKFCLCSHWGSSHGLQPGYVGGLCNSCGKKPPLRFVDYINVFEPGHIPAYTKADLDKAFELFKELANKYSVPVVFEMPVKPERGPEFITIDSIGFAFHDEN